MIFYTLADGKTNTPLHVMTDQSVYSRCCSRSIITSLNKIGVSTSYDAVRRGWALLAFYVILKNQDNLTTIHIRTDPWTGFVPGEFGTINMKDKFKPWRKALKPWSGKHSGQNTLWMNGWYIKIQSKNFA